MISEEHKKAITSYMSQGPKSLLLIGKDGVRVKVHATLLALHSPLMAGMLEEMGESSLAVSLPVSLESLTSLASLLLGRQVGPEVSEATETLGIQWQRSEEPKLEVNSGEETRDKKVFAAYLIKERKVTKPKETPLKNLELKESIIKYSQGSSDDNSDDDDSDYNDYSSPAKAKRKKLRIGKTERYEFGCDDCDLQLRTDYLMKRHNLNKHDIPINCDKCGEEISSLEHYKSHLIKDHPEFNCHTCGAKFTKKILLDTHMESKHQEDIPCPQCGVAYATQNSLSIHIERFHKEKEFQKCSHCDYTTPFLPDLKSHWRRKHTSELLETCEKCGGVFKGLKKHLERGCGEERSKEKMKPFQCSQCTKAFIRNDKLKTHIKRIHDGIKDKNCPNCSYATYSNYNLKLHIANSHNGPAVVKESCPFCEKETTNVKHHIELYHGHLVTQ